MRLAILVTNTDDSRFARGWPDDGAKFSALIALLRPAWVCEAFSVKDGVFPEDVLAFDGVMVTGSPASVGDGQDWMRQLFDVIRAAERARLPLFGACFGHQAIAVALGGDMRRNPGGWVHGRVTVQAVQPLPFCADAPANLDLYASHIEQVSKLPPRAAAVARGPDCDLAGFTIGQHVFTTQYHPEMTDGFIAALVEEMADYVGPAVTKRARRSLCAGVDQRVFARMLVAFFERAVVAHP